MRQTNPIHAVSFYFIKSCVYIIPHLRLVLPRCLFSSVFPTRTLDAFLFFIMLAKGPTRLILPALITRMLFDEMYGNKNHEATHFEIFSILLLLALRPKHLRQHPILEYH